MELSEKRTSPEDMDKILDGLSPDQMSELEGAITRLGKFFKEKESLADWFWKEAPSLGGKRAIDLLANGGEGEFEEYIQFFEYPGL